MSAQPKGVGGGALRKAVAEALDNYFKRLGHQSANGLYDLVLKEVEYPLLEKVMQECGSNQTKAAETLGLSRGTLRKKLRLHKLD